jgi:hypothetical protein
VAQQQCEAFRCLACQQGFCEPFYCVCDGALRKEQSAVKIDLEHAAVTDM